MRLSKLTICLSLCLPLISFSTLASETLEAKVKLVEYAHPKLDRFVNPRFVPKPKPKPKRGFAIPSATKPK